MWGRDIFLLYENNMWALYWHFSLQICSIPHCLGPRGLLVLTISFGLCCHLAHPWIWTIKSTDEREREREKDRSRYLITFSISSLHNSSHYTCSSQDRFWLWLSSFPWYMTIHFQWVPVIDFPIVSLGIGIVTTFPSPNPLVIHHSLLILLKLTHTL